MTTTAIAATTSADESSSFILTSSDMIHVYASEDLNPGETVNLEITPDAEVTWLPVIDDEHRGVVLKDRVTNQTVGGPGTYRLVKTATVASVAIYFD